MIISLLPELKLQKLAEQAMPYFYCGKIQRPKPICISKLGPFYAFTSRKLLTKVVINKKQIFSQHWQLTHIFPYTNCKIAALPYIRTVILEQGKRSIQPKIAILKADERFLLYLKKKMDEFIYLLLFILLAFSLTNASQFHNYVRVKTNLLHLSLQPDNHITCSPFLVFEKLRIIIPYLLSSYHSYNSHLPVKKNPRLCLSSYQIR